jgi:hypothetical protein
MNKKIVTVVSGLGAAAVIAGGAIAYASGNGEQEASVTGPQADKAKSAALEATAGGTVTGVERDDESGAAWEVEVTKSTGEVVDVELDEDYSVGAIESDREGDSGASESHDSESDG